MPAIWLEGAGRSTGSPFGPLGGLPPPMECSLPYWCPSVLAVFRSGGWSGSRDGVCVVLGSCWGLERTRHSGARWRSDSFAQIQAASLARVRFTMSERGRPVMWVRHIVGHLSSGRTTMPVNLPPAYNCHSFIARLLFSYGGRIA